MSGDFRVTALIAAYNEADVISEVIEHLVAQRVDVYLIDDGSTDDTASIAERFVGRGVIAVERRTSGAGAFAWSDILRRKEALATELDSAWFIHHDADELRESPVAGMDLCAAIEAVDHFGYNAITFKLLNFPPTDEAFRPGDRLRDRFRFYEPGAAFDQVQVKCWRKGAAPVDLLSSAGHQARFDGRRICPIPFLTLHYPIRSQSHGERKVFRERQPRFVDAERADGWHVQYDAFTRGHRFVRDPSTLIAFDLERVRQELTFALPGEEVRARDEQLQSIRQLLQESHDERRQLGEALAERQRAVVQLEAGLRAERDRAERADEAMRVAQQWAERSAASMRAAQDEARVAGELSRSAQAEAREAVDSAMAARIDAAARATDAALMREELQQLYRSRSWQVTRPLRAINSLVGGAPPSQADAPPADSRRNPPVQWGDLARVAPFSRNWGFDRGLPIDRHYIKLFLEHHAADIRGRVLEVKDANYTRMLAGGRATTIDVIDIDAGNPHATIVADLAGAPEIAGNRFDCFVLTQTVHIVYDAAAVVREACRLLAPDGVLLCTIPAVSRVSDEDGGLESGDYWRMTRAAVLRLFTGIFGRDAVHVATYGNVRTCAAFLYGLAAEEMDPRDLTLHDPWFPLIHCIRAVKRT